MKFGANTFIWESPFTTDRHLYLFEKVQQMGFDVLEVAVEDPALIDVPALRRAAQETGIGVIVCGAFGPDRNLSSEDEAARQNAEAYLQWCIEAAAELEAPVVAGPMYSAVGKARLETAVARQQEWDRAVAGLQKWGAYARTHGVKLAFEPLNRFENDVINVVDQGLALIEQVGETAVGLHLDTFHMHLEEKDSAAAICRAGSRIYHMHACENDRGIPGTGQVNWQGVAQALSDVNYQGAVVIESFTPQVQSIARAVCIWREIAPDQDSIASGGLAFLRELMERG
ncbi:MAG: sugar phosphate isomerase/epimerase [Ardenticatenaceae bacterium]|nr:sugar phosphate isomerase/epimerase [Ardenticatenaceae bacterium]MCB8986486.1 sugar phosphate isomerase/epimerase [Ardenticatenaceae bacterium]